MKNYVAGLCLVSTTAALLMSGSGSMALVWWSVGFLAVVLALIMWFVQHQKS